MGTHHFTDGKDPSQRAEDSAASTSAPVPEKDCNHVEVTETVLEPESAEGSGNAGSDCHVPESLGNAGPTRSQTSATSGSNAGVGRKKVGKVGGRKKLAPSPAKEGESPLGADGHGTSSSSAAVADVAEAGREAGSLNANGTHGASESRSSGRGKRRKVDASGAEPEFPDAPARKSGSDAGEAEGQGIRSPDDGSLGKKERNERKERGKALSPFLSRTLKSALLPAANDGAEGGSSAADQKQNCVAAEGAGASTKSCSAPAEFDVQPAAGRTAQDGGSDSGRSAPGIHAMPATGKVGQKLGELFPMDRPLWEMPFVQNALKDRSFNDVLMVTEAFLTDSGLHLEGFSLDSMDGREDQVEQHRNDGYSPEHLLNLDRNNVVKAEMVNLPSRGFWAAVLQLKLPFVDRTGRILAIAHTSLMNVFLERLWRKEPPQGTDA